jgi:predicted dehydrogenase
MKTPVRVALIGYGFLGKWHGQKVAMLESQGLCKFSLIVDKSEKSRELAKINHPSVRIEESLEKNWDEFDAALVVTPTSLHFEIIKELIRYKKHIFCEKPLTSKLEDALEIKGLLEGSDLVFQVGHSERFHEALEKLIEYKNVLEIPSLIKINRFAAYKGRASDVDVVGDVMVHDLDILMYLFNELPNSNTSRGFKIVTKNWDHVEAELKFPSGRIAQVNASRNYSKEVRSLEVTNSLGHLYVDLLNPGLTFVSPDGKIETFSFNKRDHLLIEQEKFYRAILFKEPVPVGLEDGLQAVRLVDLVLRGLDQDQYVQ